MGSEPQKILVTGTTGWIAGGVAKELVTLGHEVAGIARRETVIDGVRAIRADLTDEAALKAGLKDQQFNTLVHLAGTLGWCTTKQAVEVNVAGTRKIVQEAIDGGCKRIVVASSVATVGTVAPTHPPRKLPFAVNAPFESSAWSYAWSKATVEELLLLMSKDMANSHVDFIVVRVGATVTDPPEIVHKDGTNNAGEEVSWHVHPAECAEAPFTSDEPKIFMEDALCAVAYSDQVDCFVHCATKAPFKPGYRQIACVAPRLYAKDGVPELFRSWYGEEASKIDVTYYEGHPERAKDPLYDLQPGRDLGWEPKIDLLAARGL